MGKNGLKRQKQLLKKQRRKEREKHKTLVAWRVAVEKKTKMMNQTNVDLYLKKSASMLDVNLTFMYSIYTHTCMHIKDVVMFSAAYFS
jgi:nitric oxide reductase activation protein